MKKIFLCAMLTTSLLNAQTINGDFLDINNIKASVDSKGLLFNNPARFEAPIGSGLGTIFFSSLGFGGIDASSTLKTARWFSDFWPGPLTPTGTTDSTTMADYNLVWKINKCDIDAYYNWVNGPSMGVNPVNATAMDVINTWPAFSPDGSPLAPFWDINSNGAYEPWLGEIPTIKGDQAIFFVFNDNGGVHPSGGSSIGIEVQGMLYAYSCTDNNALFNTVFTNYKIINKSSIRLDSTFIGNFTDFDIGSANDDYVGCDVTRGTFYGYNGDSIDDFPPAGQNPYGSHPPSQGVVFLSGPYADPNGLDDIPGSSPNGLNYGDAIIDNEKIGMSHFVYWNNDNTTTGNPNTPTDLYGYMTGAWGDATPWMYGGNGHLSGGSNCTYFFPGDSDPLGYGTNMIPQSLWDEASIGNIPSDRRGFGSYGPFTMQSGSTNEFDFAYVFARSTTGDNFASVALMKDYIDSIKYHFENPNLSCGCDGLTSVNNISPSEISFSLFPNPATNEITINYTSSSKNISVKMYDATGRLVKQIENLKSGENKINISEFEPGLYLLNLQEGNNYSIKRFIKQ